MSAPDAKEHWEQHYAERDQVWSGRVNVRLAEIVSSLTPGAVLDLGCGEGGDAVWLAEHGWQVTAVDISDTALNRAAALAESRGVRDRIEFVQRDLSCSFPDGTFDLVSAHFLHSRLPMDRPRILRRAAASLRPGGVLAIVDHGDPPPWASKLDRHHDFPTAEEVVAGLELSEAEWDRLRVEAVKREGIGPNGEPGLLTDNVIVLRRR